MGWCNIEDDITTDLAPVLRKALPFIKEALRSSGARVLVHCEQGRSRSASVVVAHLMDEGDLDLDAALALVREQRPSVKPNEGFLLQLRQRCWLEPASSSMPLPE